MNGIYQLQALKGILQTEKGEIEFGDVFKVTLGYTELNETGNKDIGDYIYRELIIEGDVIALDDLLYNLGYFRTDYTTLTKPRKAIYEILSVEYVGNDAEYISENLGKKKHIKAIK